MRRELVAVVLSIALVMALWGCVALGSEAPSAGDVLTYFCDLALHEPAPDNDLADC